MCHAALLSLRCQWTPHLLVSLGQFHLKGQQPSKTLEPLTWLDLTVVVTIASSFLLQWTPTTTWPLFLFRQQQKNVSCSSKGWRDYLYFNYKVQCIWLTLNTAGAPKPCTVFVHYAALPSATAYSAAIKDQWSVHILYWFVCWISEWIFRCIYNGLIKAPFDLKITTITQSSVLFGKKCQY